MSAIEHESSPFNDDVEVDTRPQLKLILGGESLATTTEHEIQMAEAIGQKAAKGMDMRLAYMPGPPVWDVLLDCPHLIRGMVYPH